MSQGGIELIIWKESILICVCLSNVGFCGWGLRPTLFFFIALHSMQYKQANLSSFQRHSSSQHLSKIDARILAADRQLIEAGVLDKYGNSRRFEGVASPESASCFEGLSIRWILLALGIGFLLCLISSIFSLIHS